MTDLFTEPEDATPLTPQERQGLRPSWITTRADLNAAEHDNIVKGFAWARRRRPSPIKLATGEFSRALHENMFGDIWSWAGHYRTTDRNIGVAAWRIPAECANLFDTIRYWIEYKTYGLDELAVRFHHLLVSIHPFPNGNGRHSRLMADLLIERLGSTPFSWGSGNLQGTGALRQTYIATLRAADAHDIEPLLAFARS